MGMKLRKGEQTLLAHKVGITPKHLSDIFVGRAYPSRKVAEKLEQETGVLAAAWLWPEQFENPYIKRVEPYSQ